MLHHLSPKCLLCKYLPIIIITLLSLSSCSSDNEGADDILSPDNKPENIKYPVAESVDLGLSVNWAKCNMGEESEFVPNHKFAWGRTNADTDYTIDECPSAFPPQIISGTSNDIATVIWGDGWRLPLMNEFIELWDNCDKSIGEVNGVTYYKFTSRVNGNSIYLPFFDQNFCYWTGELYNDDTRKALAFGNTDMSLVTYSNFISNRDIPWYIRPVYEEYKVKTSEASDIAAKSAVLNGSVSWATSNSTSESGFYLSDDIQAVESPDNQLSRLKANIDNQTVSLTTSGLSRNTTYYFRAYTIVNGKEYLGDILSFTTVNAYAAGDLWPDDNNPQGVVFNISNGGINGKIVSFDNTQLAWQPGFATYVSANNISDGSKNSFPSSSSIPSWVQSHGIGWYCPAKNELHSLCSSIRAVNNTLRQLGYSPIEDIFWSSTQYSANYYDLAHMVVVTENSSYMGYSNGYSTYNSKSNQRGVIAIKQF